METMLVVVHWIDGDMGEFPQVVSYEIIDGLMLMKNEDGSSDVICLKNTFQVSVM